MSSLRAQYEYAKGHGANVPPVRNPKTTGRAIEDKAAPKLQLVLRAQWWGMVTVIGFLMVVPPLVTLLLPGFEAAAERTIAFVSTLAISALLSAVVYYIYWWQSLLFQYMLEMLDLQRMIAKRK